MVADTTDYDLFEAMAEWTEITDLLLRAGASMLCDDCGDLESALDLWGRFAVWSDTLAYGPAS